MPAATITVQYVNPPKVGKVNGSVKDASGVYYGVRPANLANFQQGGVYDITFSEKTLNNGTVYRTVETVSPSQTATPPRPSGGGGGNTYRETSAADKASMFVTALMKAAVQAQMVDIHNPAEIAQIGKNFRDAHALIWAPARPQQAPPQAHRGEMDDEIPF
jgi:hypothetical protein